MIHLVFQNGSGFCPVARATGQVGFMTCVQSWTHVSSLTCPFELVNLVMHHALMLKPSILEELNIKKNEVDSSLNNGENMCHIFSLQLHCLLIHAQTKLQVNW